MANRNKKLSNPMIKGNGRNPFTQTGSNPFQH